MFRRAKNSSFSALYLLISILTLYLPPFPLSSPPYISLSYFYFFRYTLAVLSDLASKQGLSDISDDHIVQWANEKVKESGKATKMRNFKDTGLKNSIFLLELVSAIEPRAVDWEVVRRCVASLFLFYFVSVSLSLFLCCWWWCCLLY